LWYFSALLVLRTIFTLRKKFSGKIKLIIVLLALIGGLLVYQTGELGGNLVYKYGIGTKLIKKDSTNNSERIPRWGDKTK
jgi:uncharacterized membrane protein